MIAAALITAAALAAPLPEGRGGPRLVPLEVASTPAGAEAFIRFRDGRGQEQRATCRTPCTLYIPRASPFVFDVALDGQPMVRPPITWRFEGFSGPNLSPARVDARLPGASR